MASTELFIRMKFDRQEGDAYYFLAGFYNEGNELPSFGSGAFPSQHSLIDLSDAIPSVLIEGSYVGTYEVPERLELRATKGQPWISDFELVTDLLIDWQSLLGFLFLEWYEVLYTPALSTTLPTPYLEAAEDALEGPNGYWNLPLDPAYWPEDESGFETRQVLHAVAAEGCQIATAWCSVFTGSLSEWHMLSLVGDHPKEPEEPYIDIRWRDSHAPADMTNTWGSYDTRFPENDFDGWNNPLSGSPQNGLIRGIEGAADTFYEYTVSKSTDTIIPYLSPTTPGHHVSLALAFADEDEPAYFFPSVPDESPVNILNPILAWLESFPFLLRHSNPFIPIKVTVGASRMYGFAGDIYPFAGETKALVTTS